MRRSSIIWCGLALTLAACRKEESAAPLSSQGTDSPVRTRARNASPVAGRDPHLAGEISGLLKRKKLTDTEVTTLYNRLDSLSLAAFDEARAGIMDLDISTYMKYRLLSRAFYGLAAAGHYDDALAMAKDEKNPANRATLLAGVIGGCREPVGKMLDDYRGFSDAERLAASGAFRSSIGSRESLQPDEFQGLGKLSDGLKGDLASGMDSYSSGDGTRLQAVRQICAALISEDSTNKGIYEQILTFQTSQGVEIPMGELKTLEITPGPDRDNLIKALSQKDPVGTASTLLQKHDIAGYSLALSNWAKVGYDEAAAWFATNGAALEPAARDASLGTLAAAVASQSQDFTSARKLLDGVSDPDKKQQLETQVSNTERDQLHGEMQGNPQAALDAIVTGKSNHSDSWLEDAMGTWVSKDPAKAQDWYEKNWDSMPPAKSQFVAAAFATQAIQQGDPAGARQWLGYIGDPSVRKRIEASLAASVSGK